jgi:hypothetical protein
MLYMPLQLFLQLDRLGRRDQPLSTPP